MIMNYHWAMPSRNTFSIKPIKELIERYIPASGVVVDPFVNDSIFKKYCTLTNDLDSEVEADFHVDAFSFLSEIETDSVDFLFFDPPYSPRQISEVYRKLGHAVNMTTTQSSYWANLKREIARIVKRKGRVVTCAWNGGGIGKTLGFVKEEMIVVDHGGWHNATISVVERKE